ncbi:drug resistance transporter, EmrB/QacA subfamily [Actinacidiphila rubida]|uniref:Drug resistance transporter, EmrB/QacA subfamily n=2 Tax=Actinacidiphila rubida TaxID=310780 RepID=A0A1H8KL60_9ACTN|nr:MFS transporter [Actinacidiphila rubida]SEN93604.1 drug resistance transporter, EmrB/QacA subfamily [Actinacidiphila rubida]
MERRSAALTAAPHGAADGHGRRRWLVLAVICCAYLMVGLDLTVMNLALPSAQKALGFSDDDRQWIVSAYALPFGSLLLFCGRLSDLVGRRRTFLAGLTGFAVASSAGGASHSFAMLVTARACQGAFAALLAPACLSLLAVTFTDPRERGRAFGVFGGVVAAGGGLGLLVGGALTDGLGWRWCLYVNLVFAVAAIAGGLLLIGRQPTVSARMDVPGVLAGSSGMFCLVYGFSRADDGWGRPATWGFLALGAALLAGFTLRQARAAAPLLPPRVALDRNRGGAYLTMLFVGAAYFGLLLFLVYYMQTVLGYSAITSGCALLPTVLCAIVMTNVGGTGLMPRVGPRPLVTAGLLVAAGATVWLTRIGIDSSYAAALLGPFALLGLGMGLVFSAALNTGTSGVAPQDAGAASASFSTGQQVGSAIGTALLTTIASRAATAWLRTHTRGGPSPAQLRLAAVHSYATVFGWSAAILTAGALVVGPLLRPGPLPAPAPARQSRPGHPEHPEPASV